MPRIIITRSNGIDPDPRVEKIARAIQSAGYSVQLLGWDKTGKLPQEERLDQIPLHRIPLRAQFGRGLANLGHEFRWQWRLASWLIKHRHTYDIIHACDFDTVLPALLCKKFFGKRIVYDIFDFYADMLRATPPAIVKSIRQIDLWAIGQTDAVILADESRSAQIAGSAPKKLVYIYNSPEDQPLTAPSEEKPTYPSKLRIAYIGLLQIERGLFHLLEILRRHPEWRLDLAGFGGEAEQMRAIAHELPNVIWHGRVSYKTALQISAQADVLFATYDPAIPNHRYSSPNKVFEAMLLGKPIIVAHNTNMDRIVTDAKSGIVIDYGDTDALENALYHLQTNPAYRRTLGKNARQTYDQTYAWSHMRTRLLTFYNQL